jgi:hypothetical protein
MNTATLNIIKMMVHKKMLPKMITHYRPYSLHWISTVYQMIHLNVSIWIIVQ